MEPLIQNPILLDKQQPHDDPGCKVSWNPGGLGRLLWIGVVPLILSICCTGIAIGIVLGSNGGLEEDWSGLKQPGVLLAYTSTVANSLMGLAFAQASVIFFWAQAVTPTPISDLHYNWVGSSSIVGAVESLLHGKAVRISAVSIVVTITALLRGPLMQRASFVQVVNVVHHGTLDLPVAFNISSDWGYWRRRGEGLNDGFTTQFSSGFSDVIRDFLDKTPTRIPGAQCNNCSLVIKAIGFKVRQCKEIMTPYEYNFLDPSAPPDSDGFMYRQLLFNSYIDEWQYEGSYAVLDEDVDDSPDPPALEVRIRRKAFPGCTGTYLDQACFLEPSVMNYHIGLQGDTVTLQSKTWKDDSYVERMDIFGVPEYYLVNRDFLWPLSRIGEVLFTSNSSAVFGTPFFDGEKPELLTVLNEGLLAGLYATGGWDTTDQNTPDPDNTDLCQRYFRDPTDYIINSYREIAFRMSVRAGADPVYDESGQPKLGTVQKGIPYTSHTTQIQYAVNRRSLILATIISLAGPLATLMLFRGWWKLGRDFSMSPLELMNAALQHERSRSKTAARDEATDEDREKNAERMAKSSSDTDLSISGIGNSHRRQRQQQENQLGLLFATCSGNASADELARHFRLWQTKKNGDVEEGEGEEEQERELRVQYGVIEENGTSEERLGFAVVSGGTQGQGAAAVRQPRKGKLL